MTQERLLGGGEGMVIVNTMNGDETPVRESEKGKSSSSNLLSFSSFMTSAPNCHQVVQTKTIESSKTKKNKFWAD